jgi:hypothetical protein
MNIKRGIEYYYNGPEAETLRASFKQMKRAAERMRAGEQVMYINSLTAAREVEADVVLRQPEPQPWHELVSDTLS